MIIQHNMMALNAQRNIKTINSKQTKSSEKLSSGFRINRSSDDAAGLSISEKMRAQIRGLNQSSINAQDGISLIQTAEGALDETHSLLHRMNELAIQAANDTNTSVDRNSLKEEIDQLASEINRISSTTQFNSMNLLDGSFINKNLQVGAIAHQNVELKLYALDSHGLGLNMPFDDLNALDNALKKTPSVENIGKSDETNNAYPGISNFLNGSSSTKAPYVPDQCLQVSSYETASRTIKIVQNAVTVVSEMRSKLGAVQNRLEHTINNLENTSENTSAAESRLRDTDMAAEMVEYSKNNILAQAGQAMLTQANQNPQGVLSLLS